jgi:hypothetical protein
VLRGSRPALSSIFAGLALALPALAADPSASPYARSGWYVGIGGHAAIENFDDGGFADSGGIDLIGGYRLTPNFAVEGRFDWNDSFADDAHFSGTCASSQGPQPCLGDRTFDVLAMTAAAKSFVPLGRIQPFAEAGVGVLRAREGAFQSIQGADTEHGFAARFGGGVDLYVTRRVLLSLGAGYVLPTGSVDDFQYISAGGNLQFRF